MKMIRKCKQKSQFKNRERNLPNGPAKYYFEGMRQMLKMVGEDEKKTKKEQEKMQTNERNAKIALYVNLTARKHREREQNSKQKYIYKGGR